MLPLSHIVRIHATRAADDDLTVVDIPPTFAYSSRDRGRACVVTRGRKREDATMWRTFLRTSRRVDWVLVGCLSVALVLTVIFSMHAGRRAHAKLVVDRCINDVHACTEAQLGLCSREIVGVHSNNDPYNLPLFAADMKACFLEHDLIPDSTLSPLLVCVTCSASFVIGSALFILGYSIVVYASSRCVAATPKDWFYAPDGDSDADSLPSTSTPCAGSEPLESV
jgi:hypothetical protein